MRSAIAARCDYTPQPVEKPQLEALIDAAIQAPSAVDGQPWRVRIIPHVGAPDLAIAFPRSRNGGDEQ